MIGKGNYSKMMALSVWWIVVNLYILYPDGSGIWVLLMVKSDELGMVCAIGLPHDWVWDAVGSGYEQQPWCIECVRNVIIWMCIPWPLRTCFTVRSLKPASSLDMTYPVVGQFWFIERWSLWSVPIRSYAYVGRSYYFVVLYALEIGSGDFDPNSLRG